MIDPKKDLLYVTVQPDSTRFLWENCVQVNRLMELGVDPANIFSIFQQVSSPVDINEWPHLAKINVWTGATPVFPYIPAMRAYMLSKLADSLPDKPVAYIGSAYPIRLPMVEIYEKRVYVSESGHVSPILMRGMKIGEQSNVLADMCRLAGLNESAAIVNQSTVGGGQYIFPSSAFTNEFWMKAGALMSDIYGLLNDYRIVHEGLNSWVADIWALQLLIWKQGLSTNNDNENMRVCYAPDPMEGWDAAVWYQDSHLAEVTPDTCSRIYAEIVDKTLKYA